MNPMRGIDVDRLVQPDRVHSHVYTDLTIFEEEIERIFTQGWIFVGHEGEIPVPGDFRQRTMARQPVIFVRDQHGGVQLLMNRCTHRANAVCHLERGNQPAFTCPYHGWRFKLDGELAVVPFAERFPEDFDRSALGLRSVPRVEAHRGFVFASLNPDVCPLKDHLGPLVMQELDDIADLSPEGGIDVTAGYHRLRYAGNWKLQVENAIDGYHANFTHRTHMDNVRFRTGFDPAPLTSSAAPARIHALGNGHCRWDSSSLNKSGTRAFPGKTPDPGAWEIYLDAMIAAHGKERTDYLLSKQGSHLYIFPNFSYTGAHFRLFQPVAPDETRVTLFPFLLKGAPREVNRKRLRVHETFFGPAGGGQSDDLEIFERNQVGLGASLDPWSLLTRGVHLEQQEADGSVSNQITDELSNRTIWAKWKQMMGEGAMA
ncbi:Phenylpropionate dioxygenase, large terminal subunit [Sphingobium faniae]|nr:Phenylpropionate dioxygenase, large terminal subunit [Sphingobium faniae]